MSSGPFNLGFRILRSHQVLFDAIPSKNKDRFGSWHQIWSYIVYPGYCSSWI